MFNIPSNPSNTISQIKKKVLTQIENDTISMFSNLERRKTPKKLSKDFDNQNRPAHSASVDKIKMIKEKNQDLLRQQLPAQLPEPVPPTISNG